MLSRRFSYAVAALLLTGAVFSATASAAKPNIVYILLDDAGYGDLSCYGQKLFGTPHIDRLATEGMRFTQHYSGSTVCAPTRCCLMTGVHTGHSFVRGNREVQPEGQAPLPAEIVTIPRLLQEAGYVTGAFGKWGLGAPGSPSDPAEHFDLFFGYNCQREAHTYYPGHLWRNREKVPLDGGTYSATIIMDQALEFVRANREQPFFLFLPVTIPHAAMHAPEHYVAPFRKKFPQFEDKIGTYRGPEVKNPIAAFAGMMTLMDEGIGDLMALLRELKLDEKTLVLLSSDNGPHQEGGHEPDFFDSNGPLRGHKRDLYEGGVRAPLIARWPGHIEAGSTSDLISAHWDMLPTFCELAGADTPPRNRRHVHRAGTGRQQRPAESPRVPVLGILRTRRKAGRPVRRLEGRATESEERRPGRRHRVVQSGERHRRGTERRVRSSRRCRTGARILCRSAHAVGSLEVRSDAAEEEKVTGTLSTVD